MTFLIIKLSIRKILLLLHHKNKYHGADKTIIARQDSCQNRTK
jgi:hypothetical protein